MDTELLLRVLNSWDGWMDDTKSTATPEEREAVDEIIHRLRTDMVVTITRND